MLVEIAIGDAYGAPFEFAPFDFIKAYNKLESYVKSYRKNSIDNLGIGHYTDDTQMSIALAEHMIDLAECSHEHYINYFKKTYKRNKIGGYSKRITAALETSEYKDFLKYNGNFNSNGSAMRSIPIGLYNTIDEVIYKSVIQTTSSHSSPEAIDSSCIISLISHYFYYDLGNKKNLLNWLNGIMGKPKIFNILNSWNKERVECNAYKTVSAVIKSILVSNSMKTILKGSINFGGDVDSVAALTMGLSSLSKEMENDLPMFLYTNLRDDKYGKNYLSELDSKLFKEFKK